MTLEFELELESEEFFILDGPICSYSNHTALVILQLVEECQRI